MNALFLTQVAAPMTFAVTFPAPAPQQENSDNG